MLARVRKILRRIGIAIGIVIATILVVRSFDAWRSPPLKLWHTQVPHELDADEIDAADWESWVVAENAAFAEVRQEVIDALPADDRIPINRYFAASPINPLGYAQNWNHSFVLAPIGTPRGAVVLLHGLTDSPYSMRHIALRYVERGYVAVAVRMPGHGTVPAGLTTTRWEAWLAATRLAVRTARAMAGDKVSLHVVGYSNGGALALKYALDSLSDPKLARPDRVVLLSPMVGITSVARFAGVLGWPAAFPAFAKSAWLDVLPEYNPFKYNSFPVNAARQSSQVVGALQEEFARAAKSGVLAKLPPVLTFQSVLDATVSTSAIVDSLYRNLPANGSELVLFDVNRRAGVGPIIRPEQANVLATLLPPAPRQFAVTVVGNGAEDASTDEARTVTAGATETRVTALGRLYPKDLYSLSHVALPFPLQDGLYGSEPGANEDFGVRLGMVAVRGERGALIVGAETLMRASSNPFFDYMLERIEAGIAYAE
ncbi:MAG TPA: alpha/beta hydrolase [Steroidobacteraceae bacterium]|nr:alpha/beta hydrolase [Steroidobacteraceae bacterium]